MVDLNELELTWRDLVVGTVAVVLGLAALIKAVKEIRSEGWKPTKEKFVAWIMLRRTRRKRLDLLITKVEEIAAELRTNGGSSLKDMVMDTQKKVEHIKARVKHQDETSTTPIFELDGRCFVTFVNCAFRELVNAEEQDLKHRNYLSRIHPDDRSRVIRELQEAIDNKCPIDTTARFRFDSSHYVQVRMLANPDVRLDGELIGFFGTAAKVENV